MTAQHHEPGSARAVRQIRASLQADRSPRNIRACLPAADREGFDTDYREALRRAGDELDLAPLHACVEAWRRTAILKADADDYAQLVQTAERVQQRADRGEPTGGLPWDDAFAERLRARLSTGG
ncbi:DUF6247 family protein [Planomonospora venezuelensis]|uniref:Uncharacterized protein n=1 Tax=Planomonospora venezuelensis TaxID=1999 RepID=A0A841DEW0_PLAVE|nr:DUF6247 family protein [Planomonospora venezuelensis]MBB5968019.1 hypothetical protein [Planomonospora venezuelensis]GIN05562.1 hypothetical protein Pve01_72200 [Planomonospora venezuelensis]